MSDLNHDDVNQPLGQIPLVEAQEQPKVVPNQGRPAQKRPAVLFLYAGLLFLSVGLGLFALGGFSIYLVGRQGPIIEVPAAISSATPDSGPITERERYNFYGRILSFYLGPLLLFLSGSVCSVVGNRLLRSAGAVTKEVIPSQDYQLLSAAISAGNDKAVSEYIRLSSLTGTTGTFTKIGLTGLPLATIFLTIFLALLGIGVPKFLDLAQLTLGAFIGSYVQKKRAEVSS